MAASMAATEADRGGDREHGGAMPSGADDRSAPEGARAARPSSDPVRRRAVIYIAGFDPRGASRYRKIHVGEARRWTELFGGAVEIKPPRRSPDALRWRMISDLPEPGRPSGPVEIDYAILRWEHVVAERMRGSAPRRLFRTLGLGLRMIVDGDMHRIVRLARIPAVPTIYPFVFALGFLLIAAAIAFGGPALIGGLLGISWLWVLPIGLFGGWQVLRATARVEPDTFTFYLTETLGMMRAFQAGRDGPLQERVETFTQEIADTIRANAHDEVLVVGHSAGVSLAASALARALERAPELTRLGPTVSLLTMGQTMSAQAQFKGAEAENARIRRLAATRDLTWVDVSAKSDSACWGLIDPLVSRAPAPPSSERVAGPKVVSAALKDTMDPEAFAAIQRDQFRRHLQYLHVFERPRAFDYFRITGGATTLAERFRTVPTNRAVPPLADEVATPADAARDPAVAAPPSDAALETR